MPATLPPIRMPGEGRTTRELAAEAFSRIEWAAFEARYGAEKTAEARRIEAGLAAGLTPAEALAAASRAEAA